jgi:signal recognition particle receptor subunit beta
MAALENEHLVVTVVYTGPPLAGKTQSVRALMPLLMGRGTEQKVLSPGDWRGRTAFFDWAVYEGGAYDGKSIHCRIISTPGQVALSDRREMLLRSADAVILVVESQPEALERAIHCYEEMAPWIAESSRDVPVRVVLQCNKQDLPGSLSAEELSRRLGVPCGKDAYPTSASTGKGLRAAFVAGVRNAVERARALVARGLVLDAPDIASGEELFERMRREVAPIGSAHPAPAGSARPAVSAPAVSTRAPSTSAPASAPAPTARPGSERPSSSRSSGRGKGESARPSGGRSSSKAPASGAASSGGSSRSAPSGRSRPAASKGASSSASIPFGTGKSKLNSGFYPATGGRPSRNPERSSTSHPPLPPDHPFAPTRPSTRRPGAGSSRPASGTSPSAPPGASGATLRPKSGDKTAPASGDDKARSTHQPRPSSAGRPTPAAGLQATAPLRSGRVGGAKGPTPSTDMLAARSSADATSGTAPARGDARQSLTALAVRPAADAATGRSPAPIESPPSSGASLVVPAAGATGSAPPSSATASAPASSARRAIVPPHSEPGAHTHESGREPGPFAPAPPLAPPSPHPKGWLDPAGATARAWRPGQGARPAILPSGAYHALVPAELAARRELLAAAATTAAADAERRSRATPLAGVARRDASPKRRAPTPAPEGRSALSSAGAATHGFARPFVAGGPRPAVMPASAYHASMGAAGAAAADRSGVHSAHAVPTAAAPSPRAGAARQRSDAAPSTGPREAAKRPAVMPMSSYVASLAARGAVPSTGSDDAHRTNGAASDGARAAMAMGAAAADAAVRHAPEASLSEASVSEAAGPEARPGPGVARTRPAVVPASAWRAALAAGEEVPTRARPAAAASNAAAPAPSGAPADVRPAPGVDDDPVDSGWPDAGEVLSIPPAFASPVQPSSPKSRRPAVMPASAWRALVERDTLPDDGVAAARDPNAGAAADASAPRATEARTGSAADVDDEWPRPSGPRRDARAIARSLRLLRGGTSNRYHDEPRALSARPSLTLLERPAVMPAQAWRPGPAAPLPADAPGATPRQGPQRPAVMPASAWRAALEAAGEPARSSVAPSADAHGHLGGGAREIDADSEATTTADVALPTPEAASSEAVDRAPGDAATGEAPPQGTDASASAPPTQPSEGEAGSDTPTLAPPSDLLLSSERPTIVAGALAEPAPSVDPSTMLAELADPATFGLESSRLIEPHIDRDLEMNEGLSDESNESFRIPETPPGLQAFVAKARLSTPPPPAPPPSDDVIPSLAPSPSPAETEAAPMGSEPHEPLEFAGPRMPGHARAPRAVWRRSTWRTLEMHINSDATALEDARGRWIGELAPGWYARTLRSASDARSARRAFAEEVLRERRLRSYLSRPRCVALTEEADRFWIWQAACRVPTLAAVLGRRLAARESPIAMAEALLDASLAFVEARQRFIQARVPLPLSLHALSVQDDELVYSGLLPDPGAAFVHPPSDGHTAFEDALRKKWPSAPVDGSAVFAELSGKAAGRLPEPILAIIRSVVGQSSIETSMSEVSG